MKQTEDKGGYLFVTLCKNGKQKIYKAHRLVAYTFTDLIPNDNPTEKIEVDHIDRNRQNNHVSNLRWVTRQENVDNSDQSGKSGKSGKGKRVLCVETGVIYESTMEASRETGLTQSNIWYCCNGQRYKTCGGFHWEFVEDTEKETE